MALAILFLIEICFKSTNVLDNLGILGLRMSNLNYSIYAGRGTSFRLVATH